MEQERRISEAHSLAKEAKQHIETHEEICALRYEGINESIKTLQLDIESNHTAIRGDLTKIRDSVNNYVISTLVFIIITLLGISSYLYVQVQHNDEPEQHTRND